MTVMDNTSKLYKKIAAASAEMVDPKKTSKNPHFNSKFAGLQETMDVVEPVLATHKLAHHTVFEGTAIIYRVWDIETGAFVDSRVELATILDGLSGNVWQSLGQAFTYLRRYLSQAFWGLVPEDDDAQSAPSRSAAPAAQRRQAAPRRNAEDFDVGAQQDQSDATMRAAASNGGGAL